MFHHLTPAFILEQAAAGHTAGSLTGACVFVDISGFTPLTLALMAHGNEGAEVLAEVLVRVFEPLIATVYANGGFIAGFAGDAFKAVFPDGEHNAARRALRAAWQIHQRLTTAPEISTRFGTFAFSGKTSVASGEIAWQIWQAAAVLGSSASQRAAYSFGGPALAAAMALDPIAARGEVVVSDAILAALPPTGAAVTRYAGSARIDALDLPAHECALTTTSPTEQEPPRLDYAARFFPAELLTTPLQGEFRRVTTVFVNFVGTPVAQEQATLAALIFQALTRYRGFLCRVGAIGGHDNGYTLLLFWGAPAGSERDVVRALAFLLALQEGSPVPLRAGVTTQVAYAGFVGSPRREEYTCYGSYVNLAARLLVAAPPGQIWLDEETARHAAGFQLLQLDSRHFKGFAQPQTVYLLGGSDQTEEPFYQGRFIARTGEISQLDAALQPLRAGRFAGVVTVVGETGMGKSRLVHEFLQRSAAAGSGVPVAVRPLQSFLCQTDEILRQPLNPFRYWLRHYFDQSSGRSEIENKAAFEKQVRRLLEELEALATNHQGAATVWPHHATTAENGASAIHALQADLGRLRPFLGALVDLRWEDSIYERLEPQLRYENILEALKTLIKAESLRRPVILHVEDVHWLDAESREFLVKLVRNVEEVPFLVVTTTRPPEVADEAAPFWQQLPAETHHVRVDLGALDANGITALARTLLGGDLAPELEMELVRRADGNPFFAEQIILYLREQNLLHQAGGRWTLRDRRGFTAHDVLSGDVRAILTARLDRLAPPVKEVVQTAAVLGREFDTTVLLHMVDLGPELTPALHAADAAAVWSSIEPARYLFRHALLRDVAYDMQLRSRLRRLHARAATAVRELFGADLRPHFADLAHHYQRAEFTEEERHFAELAGNYAAERFANGDAQRFLARALELTPESDLASRRRLLTARAPVFDLVGDRASQEADLTELAQLTVDAAPAERIAILLHRVDFHRNTGAYDTAAQLAEDAVAAATAEHDPALEMRALHRQGRVLWQMGRYAQARAALRAALALDQSPADPLLAARCIYDIGVSYEQEGNLAAATRYFDEALAAFDGEENHLEIVRALAMSGVVSHRCGDYATAEQRYRRAQEICHTIGWRYGAGICLYYLSNNELVLGSYASAERLLNEAMAQAREIHDLPGMAIAHDSLGLVAYLRGDPASAVEHGLRALQLQEEIGQARSIAYTLLHLGHTWTEMSEWAKAQNCFARAFALREELGDHAGCIDVRGGTLRAHSAQGRESEALAAAREILRWLQEQGTNGLEFPSQLYLLCYQTFIGQGEAQLAAAARRAGLDELARVAGMVPDADTRRRLIIHGPFHAALLAAFDLTPSTFLRMHDRLPS